MGVDIDETRDQPTAVMDHLGARSPIEADAIAVEEQHPFLTVGQASAPQAQDVIDDPDAWLIAFVWARGERAGA